MLKDYALPFALLSFSLLATACGASSQESASKNNVSGDSKAFTSNGLKDIVAEVNAAKPSRFDRAEIDEAAHKFLADHGMIKADEESKSLFFTYKYKVIRVVDHGDTSAVMLGLQMHLNEDGSFVENQAGSIKVIAVTGKDSKNAVFSTFEEGFKLPATVKVAIENQPIHPKRPDSLYYVELKDDSAVDALKSIYVGQPIVGFSGKLAKKATGKVDFDPTPGRSWKVDEPKYKLDRGLSIEIQDVFPELLDKDFEGTAKGADYTIAPWGAGAIRKVMDGGTFIDVLTQDLAIKRTKPENND